MLAPVWMLGLSLLYVDERVRHEGYDVELLAARQLGEMPALPEGLNVPLAPAIVTHAGKPKHESLAEAGRKRSDSAPSTERRSATASSMSAQGSLIASPMLPKRRPRPP